MLVLQRAITNQLSLEGAPMKTQNRYQQGLTCKFVILGVLPQQFEAWFSSVNVDVFPNNDSRAITKITALLIEKAVPRRIKNTILAANLPLVPL